MDFKELRQSIEKYDSIVIFRHAHPDGDALGSQLGLYYFLKDNYPLKAIYVYANEYFDKFKYGERVCDEILKKSLGIVLDTANRERIDDSGYQNCKYLIKIDHHIDVDSFGNENYVIDKASSCAEVLCSILLSADFKDLKISKDCAYYLYAGILSDTQRFTIPTTTAKTLEYASFLAKKDIDIYELNCRLFDIDYKTFKFSAKLRLKTEFSQGLAYVILNSEDLENWGVEASEARNHVSELGHVKDFKIWALFTETSKGLYAASLRSIKDIAINKIATKYGGGGHVNACGIKDLKLEDVHDLIHDLKSLINA